jgi:signal transduction histidine kinase
MLGKQVVKQIELRLRNKELERIAQAQRRIISIMAHDVRSPLSSVISLFHLYENKIIDPDRFNEFLKISSTQLQSTKVLLENLVEWGRIQLNEQPLVLSPINLREQVQRVFTELTVQASFKGNQLINAVHEATQLSMEENTLRFILRNLLTNANKFTENGHITIDAVSSEKKLVIRVIDTGIGMPAAMSERLFLTREKCSRQGTQNESGSGLGLVLIKEFIEKNAGVLRVESVEGKGSSFMIELPVSQQ